MATRAIIRVVEREEGVTFSEHQEDYHTQLYHHFDGYPEGLGVTLANYLNDISVVNGVSGDSHQANGLGCLATQLVVHLKTGDEADWDLKGKPGNVYIDKAGAKRDWIDYIYYVWATEGKDVWISIFDYNDECIFVGTSQKLLNKYKETDYDK